MVGVAQDAALAPDRLGDEDAQAGQSGRMELEELHVLQRKAAPEDHPQAVAGEGVRVGGGLEDLAGTAGGEHDRLGLEHVDLAGGQLVGDHAGGDRAVVCLGETDVQHVVLVVELDAVPDAVLIERLQDHVAGAVRRVAGPAHRRLAVLAGVPAEPALVDLAFRGPVERQAHLLQVEDGVDGLPAHDLRRVLVDQVVTTLDGVEGVPLPVVFLDVGQRGAHAALRRPGVRAGGIELGEHGGAGARAGLNGRAHAGAARSDDHHVVLVELHVRFFLTRLGVAGARLVGG
jgi:hypothetical protein